MGETDTKNDHVTRDLLDVCFVTCLFMAYTSTSFIFNISLLPHHCFLVPYQSYKTALLAMKRELLNAN